MVGVKRFRVVFGVTVLFFAVVFCVLFEVLFVGFRLEVVDNFEQKWVFIPCVFWLKMI